MEELSRPVTSRKAVNMKEAIGKTHDPDELGHVAESMTGVLHAIIRRPNLDLPEEAGKVHYLIGLALDRQTEIIDSVPDIGA